jgi:UDP-N-acetylglucosamine--N-acetylmuramyl-(pentapeptide) pyrophosphoryl-undecaprenol N-acetylglucosamine transferase
VSFAGSPDRIEARLVPEAGFELDTFRISGLPRRPGAAQLRALMLAGRAPRACARILEARRPDVVYGGGGYVAGPMVYAAWRKRIPTALAEADAHFGLANRLAAPFARQVFLAYPVPGRDGAKYRVVGRPVPERESVSRDEARRRFDLPSDGPVLLVFGGSQGAAAVNEIALAGFADDGPAVLHICGERYLAGLAGRVSRPDYRLIAWTDDFGAALAAADLVLARAGGSRQTSPPITRPRTPATSSGRAGRSSSPSRRSHACRRASAACSPIRIGSRRWARRCAEPPSPGQPRRSPRS